MCIIRGIFILNSDKFQISTFVSQMFFVNEINRHQTNALNVVIFTNISQA